VSDARAGRLERLRAEGGFFAIRDVARFAVTGGDRLRYLNGQVSNDLRKLAPGTAMQACILSAKGKLDAVTWIWAGPDRFVVESDATLAEPLAARLERYVVADDVEIAPLPVEENFHVFGPAADVFEGLRIARLGIPGTDVLRCDSGVLEATADEIERLRIEGCIPRWGAELGSDTLPAEAGLDVAAVDFNKGCYIGQEVVSRIRSVGHANRALRVFDVIEGEPPAAGTAFFAAGESDRAAATVTSVHFALSSAIGLCYIRRGTAEGATLESPQGPSRIQLRQPACALPS
jgi:folate-binding protein YgfZ